MKTNLGKSILQAAAACAALGFVPASHADIFQNGGFEDGNFNGWTVEGGAYNGNGSISWGARDPQALVVTKGAYADPFVLPVMSVPFSGNSMAFLGNRDLSWGNYDVTRISQTGTVGPTDISADGKYHLYFQWGAVMDDPPGHPQEAEPFLNVEVLRGGVSVYNVTHYSGEGSTEGFKPVPGTAGPYWSATSVSGVDEHGNAVTQNMPAGWTDEWYYATDNEDLDFLQLGDQIKISLTTVDCGYGGHDAYAYLDGFGSKYVPPPSTPDGGTTALLLGIGALGLAGLRRKLS